MCRNILRKRLRKHIEKIHLHKVVFRGASGGCHDLRCERRGSEEARRPWLRHLAPSFISHFLRLQPKQKLTAQPWRCCIMVDRPIAGRRSKSRAACAGLAKHPGIQYSEKSRCMKLQKNSRWCPVSLLIDRSLILLFTSFHINCQRMFQRTLPNDLNKFVFFLPQESHSQVATYALPWVCLGPPNKINPCGSWWRSKINPCGHRRAFWGRDDQSIVETDLVPQIRRGYTLL